MADRDPTDARRSRSQCGGTRARRRGRNRCLADHVGRPLVAPQTLERWVTDLAVVRPFRELDFSDQSGCDPVRVAAEPSWRRRPKWRRGHFETLERGAELARALLREPGADLARKHKTIAFVDADEQRADSLAGSFRIGEPADHKLLPLRAFRLEPSVPLAGKVGRSARLRDDAFQSEAAGLAKC